MTARIIQGDMREKLSELADTSIDAIVTDPPYHLTTHHGTRTWQYGEGGKRNKGERVSGFMGMKWDGGDVAMRQETWALLLRVAKPGAHLLVFSGSRTFHRVWCAVEDAGWEIRDTLMWLHGEGFPKSSNQDGEWEGWGTALKPAFEPILLARKPLIGTVADNLQAHRTGALNIEACRVGIADADREVINNRSGAGGPGLYGGHIGLRQDGEIWKAASGRWPANVLHDGSDVVVSAFPETGISAGGRIGKKADSAVSLAPVGHYQTGDPGFGDSGSAARFFWCPKASKQDRNEGLEGTFQSPNTDRQNENFHPTVKPTELMQYLCRLVTPKGGTVLDPFMGSGSTGKAAMREGMEFVGIEIDPQYIEIARRRIVGVAPLFAEVR